MGALTIVIVGGQLVNAIQAMGVFRSLTVIWTEPMATILTWATTVAFNIDVFHFECVVGHSRVLAFLRRQLVGPVGASWCFLLICVKCWTQKLGSQRSKAMVINGLGGLYNFVFVSLLMSLLLPFTCFKHPGHGGESMLSDPDVLCYTSAAHRLMITIAAVFMCVNVVPFLALVAYGTFRNRVARSSSQHLASFRFLFTKFTPENYFYGCILVFRSCIVCLIPVIFVNLTALQLLIVSGVFLLFGSLQLYRHP